MIEFAETSAAHIEEREYFDVLMACVQTARHRIYASLFLFDVRPVRDVRGNVLELVMDLAQRRSVGVDVRVLLTGRVSTPELGLANVATGILLASHGVRHRRTFQVDEQRSGSHAKFAIFDDVAIVGSQNWADDAFNLNTEDGVILRGDAVDALEAEFGRLWRLGKGLPAYGPA
jgi:phosphatidylserine/phosphatidylglycerophosphate/cardiolipin synthase-like enzyme